MQTLKFDIAGEDAATLDDMGEGYLMLSRTTEHGSVERFPTSWDQLNAFTDALRPRYGSEATKNTDGGALVAHSPGDLETKGAPLSKKVTG